MNDEKQIEEMTYEEAFANLEAIVAALEAGEINLAQSTTLYEQGQRLVKRCQTLLEEAELKISQISSEAMPGDGDEE